MPGLDETHARDGGSLALRPPRRFAFGFSAPAAALPVHLADEPSFLAAARHSRRVRFLRRAIPLGMALALAFLVARYLLRDWVERKFGSRLGAIQEGFAKNAFSYLMTLRLIPLFPFFLVNMVSGLTRVSIGTYVVATSLGIIPGSFVFAYAGRQLGTINSLKEIVSPNVLMAFMLLGLLALVPILYKKIAGRAV